MLSKRFCDSRGYLYFHDRRISEKGIQKSSPINVFVESHFYSIRRHSGEKDPALERALSDVESKANPVVEKIISAALSGNAPRLSAQEKFTWDQFLYIQWKRVPDHINKLMTPADVDKEIIHLVELYEAEHGPLSKDQRDMLNNPSELARIRKNAIVENVNRLSPNVLAALHKKGLCVAVLRHPRRSFVIGSFPVVKFTPASGTHLADPQVEVWLPIASNIAVCSVGTAGMEGIQDIGDSVAVRRLNLAIAHQSQVIAGRSKELIRSLASGRW